MPRQSSRESSEPSRIAVQLRAAVNAIHSGGRRGAAVKGSAKFLPCEMNLEGISSQREFRHSLIHHFHRNYTSITSHHLGSTVSNYVGGLG